MDDNPITTGVIPRFRDAETFLLGLRMRYCTTSSIRPTDGVLIEAAARAGYSDCEDWSEAEFDADGELKIAWAKPLSSRSRIYFRLWGILQKNAPEAVQNTLGGEENLRGHPYMREWGRRFLSGRFQFHTVVFQESSFPLNLAHKIIHFIPVKKLDYEIVPFYDIGAIGDPQWGWNETRQGPGVGIHIVLPPELVFRLDFSKAPGGDLKFYLSAGETI